MRSDTDTQLKDLVSISRKYGADPDYVLAGGGNTSFKDSEKIWVKASGVAMADIDLEGFVCLSREKLKPLSGKSYSEDATEREQQVKDDLGAAILYPEGKRPSVETSMHEVIAYPYVIHTHPTLVNGLLCARDSAAEVQELFGDEAIYIPYTDPGYVLFMAVSKALEAYRERKGKEARIIFLENHGVFVAGETTWEVEGLYELIMAKIREKASGLPETRPVKEPAALDQALEVLKASERLGDMVALARSSALISHFLASPAAFEAVSRPFTPDGIVYCKSSYLYLEKAEGLIRGIEAFEQEHGYLPKVIALRGAGIVALEENQRSAGIVLDMFEDVMKLSYLSGSFGGPRPMNPSQIRFIDNWEVENYRRQLSKSEGV